MTVRGRQAVPPSVNGWHDFLYATRGILTVHTDEGAWIVPPHRAVWIPSGVGYRLEMSSVVEMRFLFFRAGLRIFEQSHARANGCFVLNVSPLLRELVRKAVRTGALDGHISAHRRLAGVIADELKASEAAPLQLPSPKDPRAVHLAALLSLPQNLGIPPESLLSECGASRRTMERAFLEDTGMSLGQWVRRHRLLSALRMLAAGEGVESVALRLGYSSASAFIAMFRKELGTTPGKYFETA